MTKRSWKSSSLSTRNYLVSDAASLYGYAAVGASQYDKAEQRLAPLSNLSYYDASIWNARFVTTLARRDWNAVERLLMEYRSQAGDEAWSQRIQYLGLRGDPDQLRLHLDQALARPELGSDPVLHKFQQLYARGEYENAAATFDELPDSADDLHRIYAAVGLALAGRRAESRVHLAALGTELKERGGYAEAVFFREAVAFLEGGGSEKETIAAAREAGFLMLPHAYFFIGAQKQLSDNAAAAKQYFQRSVETAVSLEFPYVAAQNLAGN